MWKMFSILEKIVWVTKRLRFIAVQPAGCAPVVKAYNSRRDDVDEWKTPETIAFGLRIPKPLAGRRLLPGPLETDWLAFAGHHHGVHQAMGLPLDHDGLLLQPS